MSDACTVLICDDQAAMCRLVTATLTTQEAQSRFEQKLDFESAESFSKAQQKTPGRDFDIALIDINLKDGSGIDLCRSYHELDESVPLIMLTGSTDAEDIVSALRAGAYDFLRKPFESSELIATVRRAVRDRQFSLLSSQSREYTRDTLLLGESKVIKSLRDLLHRAADSDVTVLVTGESGTGKELAARELHRLSARASGPFVAINCAAMPAELLESELFGHEKGAFTGAQKERTGLFESASGGTLFLDEIGEMPIELQPKLLRALQERSVRRVGGNELRDIDVRLVAATNRDLEEQIEQQRFREDLYYRLNVVRVHCPALRRRGSDTLLLANAFLRRFCERYGKDVQGLSSGLTKALLAYEWPGNVRELQNVIERGVALSVGNELQLADVSTTIGAAQKDTGATASSHSGDLPTLAELERLHIVRAFSEARGNKAEAARLLGIDRRTLYRKLERDPDLAELMASEEP